ncbi:hypothetical protein MYAM1_001945 [Malassezia yamatoensis]|uniref:RRM domain-containing protein n=1 Tax=Malassezia yamatoensis TaxID=253288 RepID=A0AAJ5YUZ7_9BASI|nr:hypothetical protein MYAM1_001945 [Malassezia yamatoensis]
MPSGTPSASVCVKNINTKVKKQELRAQLYDLFGSYGKVLDVVATRAPKMRGQAFVVFRDLQSATMAMRGLDGFEFYEKPLSIDYARKKSYATLVQEHGKEALLNPALLARMSEGLIQPTAKVTYSHAQADAEGQDKKRAHEDSSQAGETSTLTARPVKTQRTESQPESNQEEDNDDDGTCKILTEAMEMADSDED